MARKDKFSSKVAPSVPVVLALIAVMILAWMPIRAAAQEDPPAEAVDVEQSKAEDESFVAPVIVDGETLFLVRGSSALPADERAALVAETIIEMAEISHRKEIVFTTVFA